jgi:hypothetical protein
LDHGTLTNVCFWAKRDTHPLRIACLIHVKVEIIIAPENIKREREQATVPTETLIFIVVISEIFALSAGALAWADFYTRGIRKS